ncbi:MAG: MFS transporter [Prevotella sp.]|nr:MFS transporter [Prevotella sp.]
MKKSRGSLTTRQYLVPFVLITTLFFLWGFARAILDVLNKHFQNTLDISITQSALIQVTTYFGYFLMAIPAGIFINRHGYRRGVVFGLLLFAAGALSFIPAEGAGFFAYLAGLFVIGCGLTFLETAANPYSTELGPRETASSRLNLSQTFNGMGCFMATLLVGQFLFAKDDSGNGGSVVVPYVVMGVVVLIIALVFSRVQLPEISHDEDTAPDDSEGKSGGVKAVLKNHLFVFGLLALLAYEVAEISINSYFVNFVTSEGWMNDLSASRIISLALVIFMVGRFIGSWMMRYMRAETLLAWSAVGTVMCMIVVLMDFGRISVAALVMNYLFEAIMFPTIFSLAVRDLGSLTKSASSLMMMTPIGGCGFLLMGYIADNTNSVLPFILPLVGYVIVMLYAFTMVKHKNAIVNT